MEVFQRFLKATWHKISSPNKSESKDDKHINITLDAGSLNSKDGSSAWMLYDILKVGYRNENFKKDYPNEEKYRHSLKEESAALSMVAEAAAELAKKKEKLNADLAFLVKLNKAGLLDAYILITNGDEEISKDYEEYRKQHHDLLERYLKEIVIPPPSIESGQGKVGK